MSINEAFRTLGFRDQETAIYLHLADTGRATAHGLSRRLSVPRSTVYWLLEGLLKRGLVVEEKKKATTFYAATRPDSIHRMVEHEKEAIAEQLARKQAAVGELLSALAPYFSRRPFTVPKLQIFDGKESIEAMLYDFTPVWQASLEETDFTWWGYQDPSFATEFLPWLKATWKVKKPKEEYRVLTNRLGVEPELQRLKPDRVMKYLPESIRFQSTIWAVGEYIVLIVTAKRPFYAFQIKDPLLASNLRTVFQLLWEAIR